MVIPVEICRLQTRDEVRGLMDFSLISSLQKKRVSLIDFADYIEETLNQAFDIRLQVLENRAKVNTWYKKHTGDVYFGRTKKLAYRDTYFLVRKDKMIRGAFLMGEDVLIGEEYIEFMISNSKLVCASGANGNCDLDNAWTTSRNLSILELER